MNSSSRVDGLVSRATLTLGVLVSLLTASELAAQDFQLVLGGPGNDRGVYATETRDGGYVAVGVTEIEDEQVFLVKTDPAGEVLWTRDLGGPGADWGWSVHEFDGGLVVAGSTSRIGAGGFDCYVAGTDSRGVRVWETAVGGPHDDHCWAMVPDADGWIVVGETSRDGADDEDCLVVGIGPGGRERWSASFGGPKSDRCFSIQPNRDGWIAAGATFSRGAGDRDLWLVGLDRAGRVLWEKTWGGEASDVAHWVAPTRGGGFLVTGYSTSFATSEDDPFLVKIDARGNEVWTRLLPFDSLVHTIAGVERRGGGLCLSGFEATPERRAALVLWTDDRGEELRTQRLVETRGESFGYTIQATSDGGCVLAGHTTEGSRGGTDLLLVKLP